MRFRIFGIPVEVQAGFWLIAVFLNYSVLLGPHKHLIVGWVLAVFVSILIHELGHAAAMRRFGLSPAITFHMMGGATSSPGLPHLGRLQRIFVSFAGPLAGFLFGGAVYSAVFAIPFLDMSIGFGELFFVLIKSLITGTGLPPMFQVAGEVTPGMLALISFIHDLLYVNVAWGLLNLVPVPPLDGGHILEDTLGPKRAKTTALIGLCVAGAIMLLALQRGDGWIMILFGLFGLECFRRFRDAGSPAVQRAPVREPEEPVAPSVASRLREAEEALADDRYDEAGTLAELVLTEDPPRRVRVAALSVIGWAHLLEGRADQAARVVKAIGRDGRPDPALVGAVLLAQGELASAREVLEQARADGDDRKEVVGPLIQILLKQGEVPRAAAIALDIVASLSDEDARQMAHIAFEGQAYPWASRLLEALFERTQQADDAYQAARCRALEGDPAAALLMLRRAVSAGFSDAARAWSDKALEALRAKEPDELEALLPRP